MSDEPEVFMLVKLELRNELASRCENFHHVPLS